MKIHILGLILLLVTAGLYSAEPPRRGCSTLESQPDNVLEGIVRNLSDEELVGFVNASPRFYRIVQHERPTVLWATGPITKQEFPAHDGFVHTLYFLSDGNLVSIGIQDGFIKVWNLKALKANREIKHIADCIASQVKRTAFSPASNVLATVPLEGNTISVWNVETGEKINQFFVPRWASSIALSPDGQTLAAGTHNNIPREPAIIHLWDVKTGAVRQIMPGYDTLITSLIFSPDGTCLVSGACKDWPVRVWNVKTLKLEKEYEYNKSKALSFLPDGKLVDRMYSDLVTDINDVATGKKIASFSNLKYRYGCKITSETLSHNGNLFAAGFINKTVIWNVKTQQVIQELNHEKTVMSVAFSLDDTMLAAGCEDGSVIVWKVGQ